MALSPENLEKEIANPNDSDRINFHPLRKQLFEFLKECNALKIFVDARKKEGNLWGATEIPLMFIGRYFYDSCRIAGAKMDMDRGDMMDCDLNILNSLLTTDCLAEQIKRVYTSLDWATALKLTSIDGWSSSITAKSSQDANKESFRSRSLSYDNELVKKIEAGDINYVKNYRESHQGPSYEDARVQIYFLARYLYEFAKRKSDEVTFPQRERALQLALFANPNANPRLAKWLQNQEIPPEVMAIIEPFLKDPAYTPSISSDIIKDDCAAPQETKKEVEPEIECRPPILTLEESKLLMPCLQQSTPFLEMVTFSTANEHERFVTSVVGALTGKSLDENYYIPMTKEDAQGWLEVTAFSNPRHQQLYYYEFREVAGDDFRRWLRKNIGRDLLEEGLSSHRKPKQEKPSLRPIKEDPAPSSESHPNPQITETAMNAAGFWKSTRTQVRDLGTAALLTGSTVMLGENTHLDKAAPPPLPQNNPMEDDPHLYFSLVTIAPLIVAALIMAICYAASKNRAPAPGNNEPTGAPESPRAQRIFR